MTKETKTWEQDWAKFCAQQANKFDALTPMQRYGIAGTFEIYAKSFIASLISQTKEETRREIAEKAIGIVQEKLKGLKISEKRNSKRYKELPPDEQRIDDLLDETSEEITDSLLALNNN
jgi:hypothetical protein